MNDALHLDDLAPGTMKLVKVDGHRVCVARTTDGSVHAVDQACPHEGYGLTTGQFDGEVITCAWHNWKFRVADGRCLLGEEDVPTHPVTVSPEGVVTIRRRVADPSAERPRLLASVRRAIEKDYVGQMSRDVVRLLRAGVTPADIAWEAVDHGAPRSEDGWGHSIAMLTDCLGMVDRYQGDHRALPLVQALSGVAETERDRPVRPLPAPVALGPGDPRAEFRGLVEAEELEAAQGLLLGALAAGFGPDDLRPWFADVVADHLLSYGHGAIYAQKAFQLLEHLGWARADTVLAHLVPTIVYGTREDTLPYAVPFLRGMASLDLPALADRAASPVDGWIDDGRLVAALLGPDRGGAARAVGAALESGAGLGGVLDAVTLAVSERMLRYDVDGERDFHDDFAWLDITHGLTYANAARWFVDRADPSPDLVRLVMWTAFLANWTGRHEWHTSVGPRVELTPRSHDLAEYGRQLQHEALLDHASAAIVVAHAVKMSVAATEEALRIGTTTPLDATARFLAAPKLERFVATSVTRAIDFLSGRTVRE